LNIRVVIAYREMTKEPCRSNLGILFSAKRINGRKMSRENNLKQTAIARIIEKRRYFLSKKKRRASKVKNTDIISNWFRTITQYKRRGELKNKTP
jgi:hypothetical protein